MSVIHKEGSKDDPDNYRGICIGSALSKTLSTMMNVRLVNFVRERNLLHEGQIGFQEKNRAPDHILTIKTLTNKYVEEKKGKLYSCFIDFRKAFDTVWHDGLFYKLEELGVNGNFLHTLKNIYKNTKCAVKFGSKLTQFFPCKQGVRQGDPLSPILFNIFINDIFKKLQEAECDPVSLEIDTETETEDTEETVNQNTANNTGSNTEKINALAYADDIVLLSTTKEGLQKALDVVHDYCSTWKLKINSAKTKTVVFSRGNRRINASFNINGETLENTKEYKYLGIIIHKKNCSFNPALKYLRTKATRAIYALRSKVNVNKLPIHIALKLFDSLIKPILLYASEVWEPFVKNDQEEWDKNDIEKTYTQFLKRALGVNTSTTTILVRGELNRHSLQEEILRRNINYAKYIQAKDSGLVKKAYTYELNKTLKGEERTTFFSSMLKHSANIYNITKTFHPYSDPFVNIYEVDKLRSITHDLFQNEWKSRLRSSIKGETYRSFKENMKFENYLLHKNRKERVALTKLRISDHKLMIEVGRHTDIPREQRFCHMCENEIEDEEHFTTTCRIYGTLNGFWNKIRDKYPQTSQLSNKEKFIFLMTQEDHEITSELLKKNYEWQKLRNFLSEYFYQ